MYLYLVRHGQSEGNVLGNFHGHTDYPLTELGHQQAREVAEKLKEISFTRCCASDLRRAWDTAGYCVEGRGVERESFPDLREFYLGDMEQVSVEDARKRWPEICVDFLDRWFDTIPAGGENPRDMLERVARCVDEIIRRGEDTLIVAHYGSLGLALVHLGLLDPMDIMTERYIFRQGAYTAVKITDRGPRLMCFNR